APQAPRGIEAREKPDRSGRARTDRPAPVARHPDTVEGGAAALVDHRRQLVEPLVEPVLEPDRPGDLVGGKKAEPDADGIDFECALATGYRAPGAVEVRD